MTIITEKPKDLPTSNALDDIEDPDAAHTGSQNIMLGSTVLMAMDPPPRTGEYIDIAMRLRIKRTAEDQSPPPRRPAHLSALRRDRCRLATGRADAETEGK